MNKSGDILDLDDGRQITWGDFAGVLRLSSGREIETWGYVGISADLHTAAGADNGLVFDDEPGHDGALTKAERDELAAVMIDRWTRWRDQT